MVMIGSKDSFSLNKCLEADYEKAYGISTNVNNTHYGMTANNWRAGVYYAGAERLN